MKLRVCAKTFIYNECTYNSMQSTNTHTQQTEQEGIKVNQYIKKNRAYKQVSMNIDVLSRIDRISKEENMSFSDVLNFLLMEALGMNVESNELIHDDPMTVADEPQSQHHEE